jgi:hypothetical protein
VQGCAAARSIVLEQARRHAQLRARRDTNPFFDAFIQFELLEEKKFNRDEKNRAGVVCLK